MSRLNHAARFPLTTALLLLATTAASAEQMPIRWQFSSTVGPVGGPMNHDYSVQFGNTYYNHTGYTWQEAQQALSNRLHWSFVGPHDASAMKGGSHVAFSDYVDWSGTRRSGNLGSPDQGLAYTIRLTDLASGESGTVTMTWKYRSGTSIDGYDYLYTIPTAPPLQTLQLGNNQYNVRFLSEEFAAVGVGAMDTPEPNTLLLAALGLTGTGLATWRKKRQRSRNAACAGPQTCHPSRGVGAARG